MDEDRDGTGGRAGECTLRSPSIAIDGCHHDRWFDAIITIERFIELEDGTAVPQHDGDLDDIGVGREGLARELLEPLHRVHELHLIIAILLFEGRGVDPPPSLFLLSSLAVLDPGWGVRGGLSRTIPMASLAAGSPIVEQSVLRKAGKIEFRRRRLRLIIVGRHGDWIPGAPY